MYHKPDCPHGKISVDRLAELPTWKLEEELLRRRDPATLKELAKNHGSALAQAETLSSCLILLLKITRLTRYTRSKTTVINAPTAILYEVDRLLAERGVFPLRLDDHAD